MKLLTPRQETLIINNVVAAVDDITELNNAGYKFLSLSSGFIAHYDRYGFIDYYGVWAGHPTLWGDLINNERMNRWSNFRPGDQNYDYYAQKARIYRAILERIM